MCVKRVSDKIKDCAAVAQCDWREARPLWDVVFARMIGRWVNPPGGVEPCPESGVWSRQVEIMHQEVSIGEHVTTHLGGAEG